MRDNITRLGYGTDGLRLPRPRKNPHACDDMQAREDIARYEAEQRALGRELAKLWIDIGGEG